MSELIDQLRKQLQDRPGEVMSDKELLFYGPQAKFQNEVEKSSAELAEKSRCFLQEFAAAFPAISNGPTWQRLQQLTLLRVGKFDPHGLSELLTDSLDKSIVVDKDAAWLRWFQPSIDKLKSDGFTKPSSEWTAADCRLITCYRDMMPSEEAPQVVVERTPIFLATKRVGKVLGLVGERIPGPAGLVTPHWWKLGLVPLGSRNELMEAIHHGFRAVAGVSSLKRRDFQIRWWLEEYPCSGWHSALKEAASVQASAACVARALTEVDAPHPLLDSKAGLSATLPSDTSPLDERQLGQVTLVSKKREAGQSDGLLTLALHPECMLPEDPNLLIHQQPVRTFGEAYHALLQTTRKIADTKLVLSQSWCPAEELASRLESPAGLELEWIEVGTHVDFIRASKTDDSPTSDADESSARPVVDRLPDTRFKHFLLGQPIRHAESDEPGVRWEMAVREDEPSDETSKIRREEIVEYALSEAEEWRRVGLVCRAGLGKTTNLQWLQAVINRRDKGRNPNLAIAMELHDLPDDQDEILEVMLKRIRAHVHIAEDDVRFALRRMMKQGRVTFLLDALDQTNLGSNGDVLTALKALLTGKWKACRVWISGRPYAFDIARQKGIPENPPWQFLRIGQFDEPECRQLLETTPSLSQR